MLHKCKTQSTNLRCTQQKHNSLLASCVAQVPTPSKTGGCIQSTNPTTHHLKSFISPTESEVGPPNHSLPAFPALIWHGTGNVRSVCNTITSCGYTIIDINGPPPKCPRQTHHRRPFPVSAARPVREIIVIFFCPILLSLFSNILLTHHPLFISSLPTVVDISNIMGRWM